MARETRGHLRLRSAGRIRAVARVAALVLPVLVVGFAAPAKVGPALPDVRSPARSDPGDCRQVGSDATVRPQLVNRGEVRLVVQALYPPHLVQTGVTGRSQVRFVVDCDGAVRPGSVEVVSATHDDFRAPSVQVVSKMRFRPGRAAGRIVPMEVAMPIDWTLVREDRGEGGRRSPGG